MRRFLLASAAVAGLTFAAFSASAQTQPQVPANPPPVASPQQTPDVTPAAPAPAHSATPDSQTPSDPAMAAPPQPAPASVAAAPSDPANAAVATPTSTADVCATRTTSVHFGARGSALSQQNRNAIEYATDAASVCTLQSITIADSGSGRTAARRDAQIRQALVRQGVAADKITTEPLSNEEAASTGRVDVRMNFAGMSGSGTAVAANDMSAMPAPSAAPMAPPAAPPANEPMAPEAIPPTAAPQQPTPPAG